MMKVPRKRPPRRKRLVAWLIQQAVPALNVLRRPPPWPYTLEELHHFPAGSWGADLAAFLAARGFTYLPKYEPHDAAHVLLGYDTTVTGELRLQAFMVGNRSVSFAGRVLLGLGALVLPELWSQLRQDWVRGRQAVRLATWDVPALLHEPTAVLQTRLAGRAGPQ